MLLTDIATFSISLVEYPTVDAGGMLNLESLRLNNPAYDRPMIFPQTPSINQFPTLKRYHGDSPFDQCPEFLIPETLAEVLKLSGAQLSPPHEKSPTELRNC